MRDLPELINWRRLDHRITLSGQPTENQLAQIKELGVTHIINLGPHTSKGALEDETKTVTDLGLSYIYIPVDFDNPTEFTFTVFTTLECLRSSIDTQKLVKDTQKKTPSLLWIASGDPVECGPDS